jgi:hypothetical protein
MLVRDQPQVVPLLTGLAVSINKVAERESAANPATLVGVISDTYGNDCVQIEWRK